MLAGVGSSSKVIDTTNSIGGNQSRGRATEQASEFNRAPSSKGTQNTTRNTKLKSNMFVNKGGTGPQSSRGAVSNHGGGGASSVHSRPPLSKGSKELNQNVVANSNQQRTSVGAAASLPRHSNTSNQNNNNSKRSTSNDFEKLKQANKNKKMTTSDISLSSSSKR